MADGISRWCARDRTRNQISGTRGLPTEPRYRGRAACRPNSLVCVSFLHCFRSAIAGSTNNLRGNCTQLLAASSLMGRLALMWMFSFLGGLSGCPGSSVNNLQLRSILTSLVHDASSIS